MRSIFRAPSGNAARLRRELSQTVHFKKNILDKIRNRDKAWVKGRLDDIFMAVDKHTALDRLQQLVADLLESECEDALACLNFPSQHRRCIRTTNGLERWRAVGYAEAQSGAQTANQDHPHLPQSGLRSPVDRGFVHGTPPVAGEQSEAWLTGKQYLDMTLLEKLNQEQEAKLRLEMTAA